MMRMVMKPEPICRALDSVDRIGRNLVVLLSPQGKRFDQASAWELSGLDQIILVCGRYEGVDERVRSTCIDREISIGDYVISGGELASMVIVESVVRLIPGVLGNEESSQKDSFSDENSEVIEYPQYTRPAEYRGMKVPDILLSGDHAKVPEWRKNNSRKKN